MTDKIQNYKNSIKGKTVSVCGIGISNLPLIDFLLSAGAKVTARDMKEKEALGGIATDLESKGVRLVCGKEYLDNIDDEIIFRTPGLRYDKQGFVDAIKKGALLTSEMQVFFDLCPCKKIAVTGSDGKTTTTTLISEILKAANKKVWLGGNIGKPLLPDVDKMSEDDFAVVELSSFQLHTMTTSPEIAVVTNISPNHLDYHTDYQEYIDAKKNIYKHNKNIKLITNAENSITLEMAKEANGEITFFSSKNKSDIYEEDGIICLNGEKALDTNDILLPGRHNVENYMAAMGATSEFVDKEAFRKVATTFKGVEHRLEYVTEKNGIKFYNGSIDSTPTRTMAALSAFKERNLVVICGGYDKNLDYAPLAPVMAEKAKCVVLTGACADKIKKAFDECDNMKNTVVKEVEDFDEAVITAYKSAEKGDIVLLSPAAASFDRFKNFEIRGKHYKDIVLNRI
ncbi:MAG: UDP-N-acetylmuramoyl-L-alanine--D-glutamate ligase [Clostridia bacterium]|nr:UDP-N-acetylmuramoyl-L-alanine--D-glutamate ligase [Clostridia bacterium]